MPLNSFAPSDGDDILGGTSGPDTIFGLAGDDLISGNAGDDSLDGGDGNDTLRGDAGRDTLVGGAGNDSLYDIQGANLIDGGAGNDYFYGVSSGDTGSTLVGGAGRDLFAIASQIINFIFYGGPAAPDRIADFQAGAGGDQLDLSQATGGPVDWTTISPNPFVAGYFRLLQSGADTLLQVNNAGAWGTVVILGNTQAGALTADNILQGWNPQGAAGRSLSDGPTGTLISGGPDNDSIAGNGGADTLLGGTGADTLSGGGGNDCLSGGDGADSLDGGDGRDTLLGYAGQDTLSGGDAADSLDGGAGNDSLDGGAGDDTLLGGDGNDTLFGGAGNDSLSDQQGGNSLSGGDGNDIFGNVSGGGGGNTLAGGAGQDIFRLADSLGATANFSPGAVNADQITDFQAGAGGDIIDIGYYLLAYATGWSNGQNPFATGTLRALQSGADTLIQFAHDPSAANPWVTLLLLRNVTASALVAGNFAATTTIAQPWNTGGGAAAPALNLLLPGTAGADTLAGGEGGDTLTGLAGADSLAGNGGNDSLDGGDGADTLDGGAGDDSLLGGAATDSLLGGDGGDTLDGGAGADTLLGGNGDDLLHDTQGANLIDAGAGDDTIEGVAGGDARSTLTGGAGQDLYRLAPTAGTNPAGLNLDVITDFTIGAGGDTLDLSGLLQYSLASGGLAASVNPFAAGYLRLVYSGANVVLQFDRDGPSGASAWTNVLVFTATTNAFTAANFVQGWNPYSTTGLSLAGDDGNNSLAGSPDRDTLAGLGGNDTLSGGAGADSLDGGTGNDSLSGGDGADTVLGGTGGDSIDGGAGNDSLDGGAGNDTILGGAGDDSITAGDGADSITDISGANFIDAGAGEDSIQGLGGGDAASTITGGAGADLFIVTETPGYAPTGFHVDSITDFTPGAGGDQLNAIALLNWSQLYGSWNNTTNPFAAGYLRLAQSGADTLLQLDRDGLGGGGWTTVLILQNTDATAFTADNFIPLTDPYGTPYPWVPSGTVSLTLTGTAGDDSLLGTDAPETLQGLAGADTLDGGAGADLLQGGDGNDLLSDIQGANTIDGGAGQDTIDLVDAGDAANLLTGGAGQDRFVIGSEPGFNPASFHADTITDFTAGAGGDVLDIGLLLLWPQLFGGLDAAVNPFLGGYLRLIQSGADTLFQLDRDGPGGAGGYVTVLTLSNTNAAAFTADNFSPPYSLDSNPSVDNGTPGNDTLSGVIGNGVLDGGAGNDSITAGPGAATVTGGEGNDTLVGLDGNAVLDGGPGNDSLIAGTGADSLLGGADNDTLADNSGAHTLAGGTGDDLYLVANPATIVVEAAGEGADTVQASVSYTLPANVELLAGTGAAAITLTGGAGDDRIQANDAGDTLSGLGGADTLTGGAGHDSLAGGDGADSLAGGGQDTLDGGTGNDTLLGGSASLLRGGDDNDLLSASGPATLAGDGGNDTLAGTGQLNGGDGNDSLAGAGTLAGDAGDDVLIATSASSLDGGSGNDTITGAAGHDIITAGSGNDRIIASGGGDSIDGGADTDTLVYAGPLARYQITRDGAGGYNVTDTLSGAVDHIVNIELLSFADQDFAPTAGNTGGEIDGTAINDSLTGTTGLDLLRGLAGNDTLAGLAGADTLDGGPGNDSMLGGQGDDLYYVDQSGDVVVELAGEGTDRVIASLAAYTLPDNVENLASAGAAIAGTGNVLANSLAGSAAADTLSGLDGNDTLFGNGGADILLGGQGDDLIRVADLAFQQVAGGTGADTLALDGAGLSLDLAGLAAGRLSGIEAIDLTGTGANRLTLSAQSVLAVSDTASLRITGAAGDRLSFSDSIWTQGASSGGFTSYSNGLATLQVANAVTVDTAFLITPLSASKAEGNAGATPFTFTIARSGDVSAAGSVGWSLMGTGASFPNAADFLGGAIPSGVVSFAAGQATATLTLQIAGDTLVEPDESFAVVLSNPQGGGIAVSSASASILNDDTNYSIVATTPSLAEGDSGPTGFVFTVTRTGITTGAATIGWSAAGASPNPANPADFTGGVLPGGTISFAAGQTSQTITVSIAGDTLVEPDESFAVTLANPSSGAVRPFQASATATIRNDDSGFAVTADTQSLLEGNSGATLFTFTISRTGVARAGSVAWSLSGLAPDFPNAADFVGGVIPSGTLSFGAAQTTATVTIAIQGDRLAEPDESFQLVLSNPSAGNSITTATAAATILNDDTNFSIAAVTGSHAEGNSGVTPFLFTVTRSGDLSASNSVAWVTIGAGPDSVGPNDFVGGVAPSGTLSFAAGQSSQTITVNVAGDTQLEPDEWFMIALMQPTGGATVTTATALSKIVNDDTGFSIAALDAVKQEGNSGSTPYTFTVTRSGNTAGINTVHWLATGKTPSTAGASDFVGGAAPSGDLTFTPGQTSQTITIDIQGDTQVEADENFIVLLRNASGGAQILVNNAGGQILNDDGVSAPPSGSIGASLTVAARADVTGDGIADTLQQSATGALYLLDGATAALAPLSQSAAGLHFLAATDLDADGRADLLLQDATGGLHAWLMNGASVLADDLLTTLSASTSFVAAAGASILLHDSAALYPYEVLAVSGGAVVGVAGYDSLPGAFK